MISIFSPKYAENIITKKVKVKVTFQLLPTGETAVTFGTPGEVGKNNGIKDMIDEESYHAEQQKLIEQLFGGSQKKVFEDPRAVQERRERAEKSPVEMAPQVTAPTVEAPQEKTKTEAPKEIEREKAYA